MLLNLSADSLFSGLISGLVVLAGSAVAGLVGSRRAERLAVAERLYPGVAARADGFGVMSANDLPLRDLAALADLQPWPWQAMKVRRLVRTYIAAAQQTTYENNSGHTHYTDAASVRVAAAALIPYVLHR